MVKKKPCKICRKWFWPNARVGTRQKVCSDPRCQRERHRRSCLDWHSRNPNYDRESRLREKLASKELGKEASVLDPLQGIDEMAARDVVGLKTYVFIDEVAKHLSSWVRDVVGVQLYGNKEEIVIHAHAGSRDEIGKSGLSP